MLAQDQERRIETPARFRPSRLVLAVDRFMTHFINVGGFLIIVAVFGIFFFIFIISKIDRMFPFQMTDSITNINIAGADNLK